MTQDQISFLKMNGAGNEIVVMDLRGSSHVLTPAGASRIATQAESYFDQLMLLSDPKAQGDRAFVRTFNRDGSEAESCGNGMRCVGAYEFERSGETAASFGSPTRRLFCRKAGDHAVTVNMGIPKFAWNEIPLSEPFADTRAIELQIGPIDAPILHSPSVANMGNPHAIFWVKDIDAIDLAGAGPMLENHPMFPKRANISVAEVISRHEIRLKVWERGAGLTQACGTAACAVGASAARTNRTDRQVAIHLPGGTVEIDWQETDNTVLMTGPWELEHKGSVPVEMLAG